MTQADRRWSSRTMWAIVFLGIAVILTVSLANGGQRFYPGSEASEADVGRRPTGYPQLVSVEPLPETAMGGEMCAWMPVGSPALLAANIGRERQERLLAQSASAAAADRRSSVVLNRP